MLIAQRPTLTEEQIGDARSRFVIEPLEPGFGYTIGNSLRRTLLSSIPGAAVTSIRIEGVLHEFSTVPGVKEDVTDIILNLKGLVVSSEHDEPVVMYLRKQGPGVVTAADITPPAGVEVYNPGLHIATLNGKGKLEMELTVERGRGYVSATQNKQPGQAGGSEVMMPVERVGMLSPMPVETPTARFCRIPAALAQDPPVPAAKAFYVNLPGPLTYDGGPGSVERTVSGVDPVLDGLSLCCGSITVPR